MTQVQTLVIADTEMVVITRGHYDKLLALAGDEDAEDRVCVRLADEAKARMKAGEDIGLSMPAWDAIEAGASPVGFMREARRMSAGELATAARMPLERLEAIEADATETSDAEWLAVANALKLSPEFLRNPLAD